MKNLYKVYSDCVSICEKHKIPIADVIHIEVNSRAKKRWGLCTKNSNESFTIQISDRLLKDDVSEEATFNTMIHELIHTCPNCMNHGKEWKKWAEVINKNTNYNIKRTTSCAEKGVENPIATMPRYIVKCTNCFSEWYYDRAGRVIKNIGRCKCPYCKDYTLYIK